MTDLARAMAFVNKLPIVQMAPDELAHTGVLGMKWGQHLPGRTEASHNPRPSKEIKPTTKVHFKDTTGNATKKKYPANSSSDHVQSRELKSKKTNTLSNADIQKVVDRLQKEQKLNQLNPGSISRGKKITLGVIAAAGTAATVYNLIDSKAGKAAVANGAKIVGAILKKTA